MYLFLDGCIEFLCVCFDWKYNSGKCSGLILGFYFV